jgi:hypothetical protein
MLQACSQGVDLKADRDFGEEAAYLSKLCKLLAKMKPDDQKFLLHIAQKAARG